MLRGAVSGEVYVGAEVVIGGKEREGLPMVLGNRTLYLIALPDEIVLYLREKMHSSDYIYMCPDVS